MNDRTEPTPAALYARVSSDRQDVDLSVAAQLRALREHADRNGYVVVREYVDEAESGRVDDRPEFNRMIGEAKSPQAAFREILVWKFSRFTRNREHAVVYKSMLRRRGVRVVSITEQADDTPTGKLVEGIIESVDEFYSENLAQEVMRGTREAASRGFWVTPHAPYGYKRVHIDDGPKKRPKLALDPPADSIVRRMYLLAGQGKSTLNIAKIFNQEGIASPKGKKWLKTTIYRTLTNEAYTGTLVWGVTAKDKLPPIRVENAFPAIVSREEYDRVARVMQANAPDKQHPQRTASPYLLSGLAKCAECGKALIGQEAKSGQYAYYVCHSLLKRGKGTCDTPRLSARRFERTIIDQIRLNVLTDSNMRSLVEPVNEELDEVLQEQKERLEAMEEELLEVRRRIDRLWYAVETTELEINDIIPRLREHQERQEKLELAAEEARAALANRPVRLDDAKITAYAMEMGEFLMQSELTETKTFIRSFVKEIAVAPGQAIVRYAMPMPEDSPIGRGESEVVRIGEPVLATVHDGWGWRIRTSAA